MQIQLETRPYASVEADALVTYVFDKDDKLDGVAAEIDRAMNGRLGSLVAERRNHRQGARAQSDSFPAGTRGAEIALGRSREAGQVRNI